MSGDDILSLFMPKEAEAKARDGFADEYAKAVLEGYPRMIYAGTLESEPAFEKLKSRDPKIKKNEVYAKTHGGEARYATDEMSPLESGRHIENLLNSPGTIAMPNFPSTQRNRPKSILYNNDGIDIVAPASGMERGDILINSLFQPFDEKKKFVERYLGRPAVPSISSRDETSPDTQQPGFSAVEAPYTGTDIPQEPGLEKPLIDPIDLIGGIPGLVSRKVPATVPVGAVANIVRMLQEAK